MTSFRLKKINLRYFCTYVVHVRVERFVFLSIISFNDKQNFISFDFAFDKLMSIDRREHIAKFCYTLNSLSISKIHFELIKRFLTTIPKNIGQIIAEMLTRLFVTLTRMVKSNKYTHQQNRINW